MSNPNRPTSAGYRLPLGTTPSGYRESYSRPQATQTIAGARRAREVEKSDEVAQSKIWREQVQSEWKGVHDWKKNWGFIKDYDPHGRPKTPQDLPEESDSYFDSEKVSPTQGHVYGSRVATELGEKMAEMEFLFHSSNRKCKMDKEFACC